MPLDFAFQLASFGLLVLIWLVQVIIYPSFRHIDPVTFPRWHEVYTGKITVFVVPLMFSQLGIAGWRAFAEGRPLDWVILVLVIGCWVSTFGWSVPCHDRLHRHGKDIAVIERLIRTNWPRTLLWTAVAVLALTLS